MSKFSLVRRKTANVQNAAAANSTAEVLDVDPNAADNFDLEEWDFF